MFFNRQINKLDMSSREEKPGFQSSAGLVRRFDVDEGRNLKIHPGWVIAAPFILAAVIALIVLTIGWIRG